MINSRLVNFRNELERRLLPQRFIRALQIPRERRALAALERRSCVVSALRSADDGTVRGWLTAELTAEWQQVEVTMSAIRFGAGWGAVNPGDRRALYYLVKALRPISILEVGTHVGASTSMLALALRRLHATPSELKPRLVTVDIADVNDPLTGAWQRIGCSHSPAEVMRAIACADLVTFVNSASVPYLTNCKERFDLIFLDGDHYSTTVYQEFPAALLLLNPGGIILLHDYFPDLKPLWSDNVVIPGPELAIARLRRENAPIAARPFGKLPWPTKLGSNVSSLAVVCRTT
jgi:predicted O-methyltransferase YrrM